MDRVTPLFTATATATGGRNGRTETSDGLVKVELSVPKAMGGPGRPGTATPEHLFAAGYAACFGGTLDFVARQQNKDATQVKVTAPCRSVRVMAEDWAPQSSYTSRTGLFRGPCSRHSSRRRTKETALTRSPCAATLRSSSRSWERSCGRCKIGPQ